MELSPKLLIYMYLDAPALECNFIDIFMKTPDLVCIFRGAIFGGTSTLIHLDL